MILLLVLGSCAVSMDVYNDMYAVCMCGHVCMYVCVQLVEEYLFFVSSAFSVCLYVRASCGRRVSDRRDA